MPVTVLVTDNFHYMDEGSNYKLGSFDTLEIAVAACQRVVDEYLASAHRPGISAGELYGSYVMFGEDPYVVAESLDGVPFSARDYARLRCDALCAADSKGTEQIVLEVGAEGGSITLSRLTREGRQTFTLGTNESALDDLLSDEDVLPSGPNAQPVGGTIDEALDALDRYPWYRLSPLFVHPEFAELIRSAVRERGGDEALQRWNRTLDRR